MMKEAMFVVSYKVQVFNVSNMSECVKTYIHTKKVVYTENDKISKKVFNVMRKNMVINKQLPVLPKLSREEISKNGRNKIKRKRKIDLTDQDIEAIISIKGSKYSISKLLYISRPHIEEIFTNHNTQEYKSVRKKPIINERYLQTLINIHRKTRGI